ncbi:ABC transporter permease [Azorhizobium oxalatiphilum]|uniref:ABC transporter permease n=1 Tax=Azorhizobium oxalatiphilum TaxID=980631 RepID=A0A917BZW6_9HYPH|nr:ABC transporter permease [Azorhizobium oxalatiphilum]GGF61278.1 ABC transporter permease [Azorhizobium oxalatiphilum]
MSASTLSHPASAPGGSSSLKLLLPLLRLLRGLAILVAVFALWEALVVVFAIRPYYLPRPSVIFAALWQTPAPYVQGFLRTLTETLIGFASGAAFGIGIGLVFFRLRALRELVFPLFIVSQTIPVIAFGALVVLWFGNTLFAKAAIAFYLTFFPVTVNTLLGLESVDPRQEALLRSFGASPRQLMMRLQFPTALPQIFVALRLASSLALVGAIVGEWFGDTVGLGVLLLQGMYTENVVSIWATLLVSAFLGTTFYAVVAGAERLFVFWGAEQ